MLSVPLALVPLVVRVPSALSHRAVSVRLPVSLLLAMAAVVLATVPRAPGLARA